MSGVIVPPLTGQGTAELVHRDSGALPANSLRQEESLKALPSPHEENALTARISKVLSSEATKAKLARRGVPPLLNLPTGSIEEKIAAMAFVPYAYIPSAAGVRIVQKIIASIRASLLIRNPSDFRYLKFFYGQADVMKGGQLLAMPQFLNDLKGTSFLLVGIAGSGKTVLIQRMHEIIGQSHQRLRIGGDAPAEITFLPMLVVNWPNCGTLNGLLANIRMALIAELGTSTTSENILSRFVGKNGPNVAIATLIFMSLGLFVLDGGCIRSLTGSGSHNEIFDFVATLQEYSGIPTLISCTYPVFQAIVRRGGRGANQGNALVEFLDLIPSDTILWNHYCSYFWKLGLFDENISMPDFLPGLLWEKSAGNMRILSQGFNALLNVLIDEPERLKPGGLEKSDVSKILNLRLRQYVEPLKVLRNFIDGEAPSDADLWVHGDYLPFEAFNNIPSEDFKRRVHRNGAARGR